MLFLQKEEEESKLSANEKGEIFKSEPSPTALDGCAVVQTDNSI